MRMRATIHKLRDRGESVTVDKIVEKMPELKGMGLESLVQ